MSVGSILLRVVLCVVLVLNGATGAYAATGMEMPGMEMASGPSVTSAADGAPCHEAMAMAESVPAPDTAPVSPRHPGPDCCATASCSDLCMPALQAVPGVALLSAVPLARGLGLSPLSLSYSAPALSHPTRPPIG